MARSRIVRRESLWSRITSAPFDLWLSLNESIESIEWDDYVYSIAIPSGTLSNLLLLFCRLAVDTSESTNKVSIGMSLLRGGEGGEIFASDYTRRNGSRAQTIIYVATWMFGIILLLISFTNALAVYASRKRYTLFSRPLDKVLDTPSCSIVELPNTGKQTAYEDESPSFLSLIWKALSPAESKSVVSKEMAQVWVLDVWEPSLFSLYFFCTFSPLNAFSIWFGPLSVFMELLLIPILSASFYLIATMFVVQQKDKSIINAEVLSEYDKQVVRPLVSVPKREAMVGTDGTVTFFLPSLHKQYRDQNLLSQRDTVSLSTPQSNSVASKQHATVPIYGAPIFPSSLGTANSIRRRTGVPEQKLHYNAAGYFTSQPLDFGETDDSYNQSSSPLLLRNQSKLLQRLQRQKRGNV